MRIKWSYDVSCIVDKNYIPGSIGEAMGIEQLHEVATHAYTLGRCIAPCLFKLCKFIDKFQNLLFYCFDNIGMNKSTLHTWMCID